MGIHKFIKVRVRCKNLLEFATIWKLLIWKLVWKFDSDNMRHAKDSKLSKSRDQDGTISHCSCFLFFWSYLWISFSFLKVALVDWIFVEARPPKWMLQLMTNGKLWGPRSKKQKIQSDKALELWPRYFTITTYLTQFSICNKFVTKYKNKTYEQCHLVTVAFIR